MSSGRLDDPSDRSSDRPDGALAGEERRRLEDSIRDLNHRVLQLEGSPALASTSSLLERLRALEDEVIVRRRPDLREAVVGLVALVDRWARHSSDPRALDVDLVLEALAEVLDQARQPGPWPEELQRRLCAASGLAEGEGELARQDPGETHETAEGWGGGAVAEQEPLSDPPELESGPPSFAESGDIDDAFLLGLFREQFLETGVQVEQHLLEIEKGADDPEVSGSLKRHVHNLKGAAYQAGLEPVGRLLHAFEERLRKLEEAGDLARAGELLVALDAVTTFVKEPTEEGVERLESLGEALLSEDWRGSAWEEDPAASDTASSSQSIRVQIDKLDALLDVTGEIVQQQIRLDDWLNGLRGIAGGFSRVLRRHRKLREYIDAQRSKVPPEVGDRLVGMEQSIRVALGELHKRVTAYTSATESEAASSRSLTARLKDHVMSTRMVPVRTLFASVPRIIRDVGGSQNKSVHLVLEGEETELDRRVVDAVRDPLLHLVRNAIDHGLETEDERRAAGKSPQGRLTLAARQHGGLVHLRISDDGRGVDTERVRQRASQPGWIEGGSADSLDESEILQMLFKPGFSTRDEASPISGRGIGLDVVQRVVSALNGQIEIESVPGRGTSFLIKLPLTLAIVRGLIVESGAERFVIPCSAVENLIQVDPRQLGALAGRAVLEVEGRSIPVEYLAVLVGAPPRREPLEPGEHYVNVILLSHENRELGVIVDAPLGEHWTVVKQLDPVFDSARLAAGATTLGSGEVVVVLDAGELVRASWQRRCRRPEEGAVRSEDRPARRVLVRLDASSEALESALADLGLQGRTVKQPGELHRLARDSAVAMILMKVSATDRSSLKEVSRLKRDRRTRDVPVLLLGTQDSAELRRVGLEAGANGFIGLAEVESEAFRRLVHRFTRSGE